MNGIVEISLWEDMPCHMQNTCTWKVPNNAFHSLSPPTNPGPLKNALTTSIKWLSLWLLETKILKNSIHLTKFLTCMFRRKTWNDICWSTFGGIDSFLPITSCVLIYQNINFMIFMLSENFKKLNFSFNSDEHASWKCTALVSLYSTSN